MQFYAPKNFKKGKLIGGIYRPIDLMILIGGLAISFLAELIYMTVTKDINAFIFILLLIPVGIAILLTAPLGVYHNVLQACSIWFKFQLQQKNYKWEGICLTDEIDEEI